ncbi:unnamed protein product [Urochloa decumbens]|uniref:Disease resistance N-terminal domain-containing protein n=1 Tax=Urochloa decumbens TaxID=240449 RepID=A0ABC9GDR3_9POAL
MSLAKRKVEELGEQVVSAAVGDVFARTMSAAVGRYAAHASVGEQLERLGTLVIMVHSAVEAAEGVHIRSWWLRRWLWRLRDAALDGDEVLRSLTRRRQQEKADEEAAGGGRLWNAARRVFRSAKSLLLAGYDSTARLSAAVARLESVSTGLADFLKLLDMEISKSRPPPLAEEPTIAMAAKSSSLEAKKVRWSDLESRSTTLTRQQYDGGSSDEESPDPSSKLGAESEDDLSYSSYKEHNAARRKLIMCAQSIRRAMSKRLTTRTPAAPSSDDCLWTTLNHRARLCDLVGDIRRAVRASDRPEVHGKMWLAEWRRELQDLADTAERVLLVQNMTEAAGVASSGEEEVRRTAQSVHTMAAHLKCFVTLVRLAVSRDIPTA